MGYRRIVNRYKMTGKELERQNAWMMFLFILAGPFTFGGTWVAAFILYATEDDSSDAWDD